MIKRFITTTKIDKNRGINNNILLYYAQKNADTLYSTRTNIAYSLVSSYLCSQIKENIYSL